MIELNKKTLRNVFLCVIGGILVYWVLHESDRAKVLYDTVMGILSPFLTGAAIAFILNVPMRGFESLLKKVPNKPLRRVIALILTVICVLVVLAGVFWLLIPQLIETIQSLIPKLYDFFLQLEKTGREFLEENPELMEWIYKNTDFEKFDWAGLVEKALNIVGNSVSTILQSALTAIGSVASAMVEAVVALVFAIYCLFQKETLARQGRKLLYAFLPEGASDYIVRVLRLTNSTFSNFLSGQCVEVCILGSMFAISMAIFKMPYIPLVSVLVAVTAFIPIVGAFVGCIVGAFFIMVHDPVMAVGFVIMFLVLQQIENNVIYPRVVGSSIGLPGMWVLVAVSVGGEIMGVAGMFLMIPMSSVLYTLMREWTNRRLQGRDIAPEKLIEQPPELRSRFKAKRKKKAAAVKQQAPAEAAPEEPKE